MTLDDATNKAKFGHRIRAPWMAKDWTVAWLGADAEWAGLFCINPITGSNYAFTRMPGRDDKDNWSIVS